jgi:hypothetical protein
MLKNRTISKYSKTIALLFFVSCFTVPLFAQLTYSAESSIEMQYSAGNTYGALVGTLTYSGSGNTPNRLYFSGTNLKSSNGVTFSFLQTNGTTEMSSINGYCYLTNNSNSILYTIDSTGRINISSIDWDYPVYLYLFFDYWDIIDLLNNSSGTLVSIATDAYFYLAKNSSALSMTYYGGTDTQPVALLGGGAPGPMGINSVPVSYYYSLPTSDVPEYNIGFTISDVSIEDLSDAINTPINITNLQLEVLNYDDVYMGQTNVQVKFFQTGYSYFTFVNSSGNEIPFSLSIDGTSITPYVTFFPWTAPLVENNLAPIGFSVTQTDYDQAEQGDYNATITVELITGV